MQLMAALILMNVKTLRHVGRGSKATWSHYTLISAIPNPLKGEKSKAISVIHVKILSVHIFVIVMRDFDYLVQIVMI